MIKIWRVVKTMFQNLTCCKISDSKNDELLKVDYKSDVFWKSWFKVWRAVKNLFQKVFLFWKFWFKKCFFFHFFSIMVFEKSHNWRRCRFCGIKGSKNDFLQEIIHQNLFLYKSSSLQNMICCKTFFSKSDEF